MLKDEFYVTFQPLVGWDWQSAAARLFNSREIFLKKVPGHVNPVGEWELTCFPLKGYTDQKLNPGHIKFIRGRVKVFLAHRNQGAFSRYNTIKELSTILIRELEYPPLSAFTSSKSNRCPSVGRENVLGRAIV
jgi:hypothetical protein